MTVSESRSEKRALRIEGPLSLLRGQWPVIVAALLPVPMYLYVFGFARIYWPVFAPLVVLPAALGLALKLAFGLRRWWLAIPESVLAVWLTYQVVWSVSLYFGALAFPVVFAIQMMAGTRAWGPVSLLRDLVCLWCIHRSLAYGPLWTLLPPTDLIVLAGRQAVVVALLLTLNGDRFRMIGRGLTWVRGWVPMQPVTNG